MSEPKDPPPDSIPPPLEGEGGERSGPGEGARPERDARGARLSEAEQASRTPVSLSPPQERRGPVASVPRNGAGPDPTSGEASPSPLAEEDREGNTRHGGDARDANAPDGHEGGPPRVTRLTLQDFRTYAALDLPVSRRLVALVGENGAGKTNLLEALSLFMPGRGLRRAELAEMARQGGPGGFAVSVALDTPFGEHRLGTGIEAPTEGRSSRICRIDGAGATSPAAFAEYLRVVWLTPDLDALFRGPAGDRRRFLDRLVLAVDAEHGARVNALERALRSRNRILEEASDDALWLDAVEREVAELGIAVVAARRETVERLSALVFATRTDASPFPFATLALEGELDALVATLPAVDAEDRYRAILRDARPRDRAAGRTLVGPQASDLLVRHGPKDIPAGSASTGEQKALLIGLVLAHARLVSLMSGMAPLVLLDEVAAHLDPRRRAGLFDALARLGSQVWMTGADPAVFAELEGRADLLQVEPGRVRAP